MQFQDYQAYLILFVFVASGVSLLNGAFARVFVRITVALVGIICALLISGAILFGIAFSAGFGATSLGQDGPKMLGAAMLVLYFAICSLSCLRIISNYRLRFWGIGLHFIYLPMAVLLTTVGAPNIPIDFWLSGYANELSIGLIYAMLWFRMVDAPLSH